MAAGLRILPEGEERAGGGDPPDDSCGWGEGAGFRTLHLRMALTLWTGGEEALSLSASPLPGASLLLSRSFTQVPASLISSAAPVDGGAPRGS